MKRIDIRAAAIGFVVGIVFAAVAIDGTTAAARFGATMACME